MGDTITRVDEKPVQSLADWHQIFRNVKPGHMAEIKLQRGPADAPQSLVFETQLIQAPMDVVRMVDDKINEEVVGNFMKESCLTTLAKIDKASIPVGQKSIQGLEQIMNGYWEPRPLEVPNGSGIEFVLSLDGWLAKAGIPAKLELVKQYRLTGAITGDAAKQPKGYELDMKVTVRNRDDVAHQVAFRQHCFNGLTLEGWWYLTKISPFMFEGAGSRDVVYGSKELGHNMVTRRSIFSAAKSNLKDPDQLFLSAAPNQKRSLKYLGVDGQFFAAAILPHPEQSDGLSDIQQAATTLLASPSTVEPKQMAANVSAWFDTSVATIEPNQEWSKQFTLFAGPKDPQVLDKYGLGSLLEYGWFGWVAKPLTLLLHTFYAVARNYGIAIVMLTVLVRSIMFPFSRRAAINAQKMQEVAPELKRINELYKDDWEKENQSHARNLQEGPVQSDGRLYASLHPAPHFHRTLPRCFARHRSPTATIDSRHRLVLQPCWP